MKAIMCTHLVKYPKMQTQDMVKLLYQSEFAGGHMIADEADSLLRLETECRSLPPVAADGAFEDIGGGLCRLHLGALSALSLTPQTVNRLFVATANKVKGAPARFSGKLDEFLACCRSGELPFDMDITDAYVHDYRKKGCPPISHSDVYRAAYSPAYRVIKTSYGRYIDVFRHIDTLLEGNTAVTVAIEGNSGAGKSTLSALLAEVYDCNVFHTDDFFLPPASKTASRLSEPGGNVDYERLHDEIITGLKNGGPFSYRKYSCQSGSLSVPVRVAPKRLNIIEGVYSLHPALDMPYDLRLFIKAGVTVQKQRILERSGAALLRRFENEWIPLENRYFDVLNIMGKCDIVYEGEFSLDECREACI